MLTNPKGNDHAKANHLLRNLAFDNSLQANIITNTKDGNIILVNKAACKLLGYSNKDLLTQSMKTIFETNESSFKKMLKEKGTAGLSIASVIAIKKSGNQFPCEITCADFTDDTGIKKTICTLRDMSAGILKQKNIDSQKDKAVTQNISLTKSKQKNIDNRKEKIVIGNIHLAKSKQKILDTKNKKIVADDIIAALAKYDARLEENNEWIKNIAKNSYDVMWDWDVATGKIYVGDSIKEVFGYNVRHNSTTFSDFIKCLVPEEKDRVEEKLAKVLSSRKKSWSDSYYIKHKDGSVASTTSRASIVRDDNKKAIRLIGATQDTSKINDLEKKLEDEVMVHKKDSQVFQMAAKLSFDVIWDWDLGTNEVYFGDGYKELFGNPPKIDRKQNLFNLGDHFHPDDRAIIEERLQNAILSTSPNWEYKYRIIRAGGSVAYVLNRASILRQPDGKAYRMIGAIHDLSPQKELEEKLDKEIESGKKMLSESTENFKLIFNSSSDVLYDLDLVANTVLLSDAYAKEFGYKITGNMTPGKDWFKHFHPDDQKTVMKDYKQILSSGEIEWKYNFRFLKADGSVANVTGSSIILRDIKGKAYRLIGSMRDISKETVLEERLQQEIHLKEKQIFNATEEARETERSGIGKELHDNVNQLLGASRLYLNMAKRGGNDSETYLSRSSDYTLLAIEEIRKLTKGLTTDSIKILGFKEAVENIIADTMEVNSIKIVSSLDSFTENSVNEKFKLNLFRIVQEHLNNILKHSQATKVEINLLQNKKSITLSIIDNGVGFDTLKKHEGIGLANIKSRAEAYNGRISFVSRPGQGCILNAKFLAADPSLLY